MTGPDSQRDPDIELSFTAIERLLHLPSGSATTRRLTILAVSTECVPGTALRRRDRLVVEPGTRMAEGHLLACQSREGIVLRRLRFPARGEAVLAQPDQELLPLPDNLPCVVFGTVVGIIRPFDDARVQVAFAPRYEFGAAMLCASTVSGAATVEAVVRRANSSRLESLLGALDRERARTPAAARHIEAAKTRLHALGKCLDAVNDERIYRALAQEINATVLRLRRVLATDRLWLPLAHGSNPKRAYPQCAAAHRPANAAPTQDLDGSLGTSVIAADGRHGLSNAQRQRLPG